MNYMELLDAFFWALVAAVVVELLKWVLNKLR